MIQSNRRTVAIYCRTAQCDSDAIEMQQTALIRFANERGYADLICYADNGVSGLTFQRPAFMQMATDIEAGQVQAILVRDLSRIGRNNIEVLAWIEHCQQAGIEVISMNDDALHSPVARFYPAFAALVKGGSYQ